MEFGRGFVCCIAKDIKLGLNIDDFIKRLKQKARQFIVDIYICFAHVCIPWKSRKVWLFNFNKFSNFFSDAGLLFRIYCEGQGKGNGKVTQR